MRAVGNRCFCGLTLHPFIHFFSFHLFCPFVDSAFFRTSSDPWVLDLPQHCCISGLCAVLTGGPHGKRAEP